MKIKIVQCKLTFDIYIYFWNSIDLFSILNPRLQHIYNIEDEDMEKSFKD